MVVNFSKFSFYPVYRSYGLDLSTGVEDYKYYLSQMAAYSVDCFGLVETNTAWQHYYLQLQYRECVQRQFRIGKTVFGFPSQEVDPCSAKETFQAGGCLTTVQGRTATTVRSHGILDPTGLGRWSGVTLEGKGGNSLSIRPIAYARGPYDKRQLEVHLFASMSFIGTRERSRHNIDNGFSLSFAGLLTNYKMKAMRSLSCSTRTEL